MGLQFGFLARLTWWEYSWDIMEPVTYFVTYGTAMAMYAYHLLTIQVCTLNGYQSYSGSSEVTESACAPGPPQPITLSVYYVTTCRGLNGSTLATGTYPEEMWTF